MSALKRASLSSPGRSRKKSKENDESEVKINYHHSLMVESQAGIIQKISLQNFMCHSNLEFELGPNINFIIGRNGSGKSAISNAILLAFGGRSGVTGKNQALTSFIQTNKQIARICLTLKNTGPEAYKPEIYGKYISIERRLYKTGHGSYIIKSAKGETVSSKKEELIKICDSLNIHINNPVAILTQDGSKTFLQSKDPKKKYELFFKSTELEKVFQNYEEAEHKRNEIAKILSTKERTLPEMKKDIIQLKRRCKVFQMIKDQKEKINQLKNELAWATVRDSKNNRDKLEKALNDVEKKNELLKQAVEKNIKKRESIDTNLQESKKEGERLKKCINDLGQTHETMVSDLKQIHNEIRQEAIAIRNIESSCDIINRDMKLLQRNLDELNKRSEEDLKREQAQNTREVDKLRDIIAEFENRCQLLEDATSKCQAVIDENEFKLTSIDQKIETLNHANRKLSYDLKTFQESIKNREVLYGNKMPILLRKIKENSMKFKKAPIGPLGLYVKVKDKRWMFAIEKCLSQGLLNSFCCDNTQDAQTLRTIMKQVFTDPNDYVKPIITSQFLNQVYEDVPYNQFKHPTVLDLITSDNPVVMNCLIDQRGIESVLLIEETNEAMNAMEKSVKGVSCCFTVNGDQIYPYPNYRFYSCKTKPNSYSLLACYDQKNIEEVKNTLKKNTQQIEKENEMKLGIKKTIAISRQEINNLKSQQNLVKRQILSTRKKEDELIAITMNQPDTSSIINELKEKRARLISSRDELEKLKDNYNKKKCELDELKKKRGEQEALYNEAKDQMNSKINEMETLERTKQKYEHDLKGYQIKIKEENQRIENAKKELASYKAIYEENIITASKFSPEIRTHKSVEDLKNQITELENIVEEHNNTHDMNEAETLKRLEEKETLIENCQKDISLLKEYLEHLKASVIKRRKQFNKIRNRMAIQVQYIFSENMISRGFRGELVFDHENQTLTIFARPGDGQLNTKKESVQSLSGGERSFVTVALLLALSDVTEIPFHILDEYDVYMDSMNKELSLRMMLGKADEQRQNQFIFLSPLELPSCAFSMKDLVKIHKMPDPDRTGMTK